MKTKYSIISLLLIMLLLLLGLGLIDPRKASLVAYLVLFLLVYLAIALFIYVILNLSYRHLADRSKLFISIVMAFTPLTMLAIASYSNLTVMDIILATALPSLFIWYLHRRKV